MSSSRFKPLIPHKISIDGKKSYKTFFKQCPKLMHTLEIDIYSAAVINPTSSKIIKQTLIKLAKKTKLVQSLRLHKCLLQSTTKNDTKVQAIRKLYRNVRSLYISLNSLSEDLVKNYTKWLTDSKRLTNFYFILRKYIEEGNLAETSNTNLHRFLLALKRRRLHVIKFLIEADYSEQLKPFLCFKNYPSTLKRLTINWRDYGASISAPSLPSEEPCLSHLKSLELLNLCIPLPSEVLQDSLVSIPGTSRLIFTDIEPCENHLKPESNSLSLVNILERFDHLNGITIKLNSCPGLSEPLPTFLRELPLKKMKVETIIEEAQDLIPLGVCLGNLEGLESLVIKVRNTRTIDFGTGKCFESFFGEIGKLKHLTKLKLYFTMMFQTGKTKKVGGFLPALSGCVEKLKKLEQLSFRFRHADFAGASIDLFKALKNNASEFKKLRINFAGQKLQAKESVAFMELLSQMPKLESLRLGEYFIEGAGTLKTLWDVINPLSYLRTLKFGQVHGRLELEELVWFIRESLMKRSMRKFCFTLAGQSKRALIADPQGGETIDLQDVVRRNSALQMAYVPLDIFESSDDIFMYKWT